MELATSLSGLITCIAHRERSWNCSLVGRHAGKDPTYRRGITDGICVLTPSGSTSLKDACCNPRKTTVWGNSAPARVRVGNGAGGFPPFVARAPPECSKPGRDERHASIVAFPTVPAPSSVATGEPVRWGSWCSWTKRRASWASAVPISIILVFARSSRTPRREQHRPRFRRRRHASMHRSSHCRLGPEPQRQVQSSLYPSAYRQDTATATRSSGRKRRPARPGPPRPWRGRPRRRGCRPRQT